MRKSIFTIFIVLILAIPASAADYKDMDPSHWAYGDVVKMTDLAIVDGYPDGSFQPNRTLTYGEFIKMAAAVGGAKDLRANGHWALPYYDWSLNMGYFSQYDIDVGVLDRSIPRGHMALIASSMLGDINISDYSRILDKIEDINSRTPNEHHIVRAYSKGILAGYPDGTFKPEKPLTRAEAISVIGRLAENIHIPEPEGRKEHLDISTDRVLTSDPEGTFTLTVHNYDSNIEANNREIKSILEAKFPGEASELFDSFYDFAMKWTGDTSQGIRKHYIGDYPVLIERIRNTLRIFVLPVGYTNRTWETEPGQVNEFFF